MESLNKFDWTEKMIIFYKRSKKIWILCDPNMEPNFESQNFHLE